MPRFGKLSACQIRNKSSAFDIVTDTDEASVRAITSLLRAQFPACVVIGEEAADKNPDLLRAMESVELVFLVDPLDACSWSLRYTSTFLSSRVGAPRQNLRRSTLLRH